MVQNAAARLITETNRTAHLTPVLFNLHRLSVKYRFEFKILVLTFRALHGQTPQYIADMLTSYSSGRLNHLMVPKNSKRHYYSDKPLVD